MDWNGLLNSILITITTGVLTTVGAFIVKWLRNKIAVLQEKSDSDAVDTMLALFDDVIITNIEYANQTVVDELKKQGKFDKEAQEAILNRVKDDVLTSLGEDISDALEELYQIPINELIEKKIESLIHQTK